MRFTRPEGVGNLRSAKSTLVESALRWSARLRSCELRDACPLAAIAANPARPLVERARAAAVGSRAFGDEAFANDFRAILEMAGAPDRATILAETAELCPALVPAAATPAVAAGARG